MKVDTETGTTFLSQPEFREYFEYEHSEEVIKYNYDRYTWFIKVAPIRKKKMRAKVAREAGYEKFDFSRFL